MIEQLWPTRTRIFTEATIRSGTPMPGTDVIDLPMTAAGAARMVDSWDSKTDWRRKRIRPTALHQHYELRTSHEASRALVWAILADHLSPGLRLDNLAPTPTYGMQVETQAGDCFAFHGMALAEFQLTVESATVPILELTWHALDRQQIGGLEDATGEIRTEMLNPEQCTICFKPSGSWPSDPRSLTTYASRLDLFMSRPELSPVGFQADGRPTGYPQVPVRVIGEMILPAGAISAAAKDRLEGALMLCLGPPDGNDVWIEIPSVTMFANTDPIRAEDFRDEALLIEAGPDTTGAILAMAYGPS